LARALTAKLFLDLESITMTLRFGSVCSGIEAASTAWNPLGWEAAWLSEIEPFPSAVLAHHYPDVPNLGDMTLLPDRISSGEVEAPDLFCGGTPCQAFSVAGLRKSLDDARGNLSLVFCEIANAIDTQRAGRNQPPAIIFWENVPGVLSTKDNAFGCFLAGLAGEENPVEPPRGKWTNAGVVLGPQRTVAWRILDAQYFGVAQRRRRVFVVASARDDFDPASVLLEFDGVRRDSAPSRQARQNTAASAGAGAAFGGMSPVAGTLTANTGGMTRPAGNANELDFCVPVTCMAHGQGGAEIATDRAPTLTCNHEAPIAAYSQPIAYRVHGEHSTAMTGNGVARVADPVDITRCLDSSGGYATNQGGNVVAQPIGFNARQDPDSWQGRTGPLDTDGSKQAVAIVGPLACNTGPNGHDAGNFACNQAVDAGHVLPVAQEVAYTTKLHNTQSNNAGKIFEERSPCLDANSPAPALLTAMAVRRLTPVECERLQGFPDGYTNIPWRKKDESPDGPRYKALGNSWAVPVVRWIGRRIHNAVFAAGGERLKDAA
jgi:DNA (cytosine-5)-methyltransferase 1